MSYDIISQIFKINQILEWPIIWICSLFTVQPITSIDVLQLINLYVQYFILGLLASLPLIFFKKKKNIEEPIPIPRMIKLVLLEDSLFRVVPIALLGKDGGIGAHIIWAILHFPNNIIFVAISGLLMLRLWLGGLWTYAIFIHIFHNTIIYYFLKWRKSKKEKNEQYIYRG